MKSLRILIVTHAPLSLEFGAGQMAINLGAAFRDQGHEVTLYSIDCPYSGTKWWQKIQPWWQVQQMRIKLEQFIHTQEPFDVIDIPGGLGLITPTVSKSAPTIVARSVQPHILYIINNLKFPNSVSLREMIIKLIDYFFAPFFIFFAIQDYQNAKYIL
jgi:hypothetical protein